MKKPAKLAREENQILEVVAIELNLNPDVAREMLDLTRKLDADMDQTASLSKPEYTRALGRLVEQVAAQSVVAVHS